MCRADEVADDRALKAGDEVERLCIEQLQGLCESIWVAGLGGVQPGGAESGLAGHDGIAHGVEFDVAADGCFDAAEGEVEAGFAGEGVGLRGGAAVAAVLDTGEAEGHGFGVAVGGEGVDPGPPG